MKARRFSRPLQ